MAKAGRYEDVEKAQHPGPELPRVNLPGRVETVIAAVDDPTNLGREKLAKQKVAVNRQTDMLEYERSRSRISENAYLAGRLYIEICERAATRVAGLPLERTHGAGNRDLAMVHKIDRTREVVAMQCGVRSTIGKDGAYILRLVLQDGLTFEQIASAARVKKRRRVSIVARMFREGLESLSVQWDRIGWPRPR